MNCISCGKEVKTIMAKHEYDITYDEEQEQWIKSLGEVEYRCSECGEELDRSGVIADILRKVDEL